jgi:NADH-quinone oxidoreductase subunit G
VATLYVDGIPYEFEDQHRTLLEVCLSLGFDVPYFCWHPAMHSVGACRQCAVKQFKDENDSHGKIVMSCMTQAGDGMRISIDDPEVKAFRAAVIEWLMLNHPHDCPVCDEGGECHLQDMTVMSGHVYRRNRFPKRTFRNQDLGPFLHHEMNRCIQCYRCIRFYRDIAGGRDLEVFGCHDDVYFGRYEDGALASGFSGNLVEICPTGVFTDKTFRRHFTRVWDLQTAPSVCVHCALGCNTLPGERYGMLRRIRNRYHYDVNGYFLCDRGRFGYEFVNGERRIRRPRLRGSAEAVPASAEEAVRRAADLLGRGRLIGIGSPRASVESNFALFRLVGAGNFFHGLARRELDLIRLFARSVAEGPTPIASLRQAAESDGVLVLGEDIPNTAPLLTLAIRQAAIQKPLEEARNRQPRIPAWEDAAIREAIQQERGPVYVATPAASGLDELASESFRGTPQDIARLAFELSHRLDPESAAAEVDERTGALAQRMAGALRDCRRPLVVCGTTLASAELVQGACNVAWALTRAGVQARLSFVAPECNSMAAALLEGGSLEDAVREAASAGGGNVSQSADKAGAPDAAAGVTVVIVENDLTRRLPSEQLKTLFAPEARIICIDHVESPTTETAAVLLPAAPFAEASGTLVSSEGRAQAFYAVFAPEEEIRPSWRWIGELLSASGKTEAQPWPSLDSILEELAGHDPKLSGLVELDRIEGSGLMDRPVPRLSRRASGRTAEHAARSVHEQPPPPDPDTPLSYSMEGFTGSPPSALVPRYWAPGWNSVQSLNKLQTVPGGPLRGGSPGLRLLEPGGDTQREYYHRIPDPFKPREGEILLLPLIRLFGSEELSRLAPGIASLILPPALRLHPQDAGRLGLGPGTQVELAIGSDRWRLPLELDGGVIPGTALVPAGFPGESPPLLPAWATLGKIEGESR